MSSSTSPAAAAAGASTPTPIPLKIPVVPLEEKQVKDVHEFFEFLLMLPEDLQKYVLCCSQKMPHRTFLDEDVGLAMKEVASWYH